MDVVDIHQLRHDGGRLVHAELARTLDGVDGIVRGVGQGHHLGLRCLGLHQKGRKITRVERVVDRAQHAAPPSLTKLVMISEVTLP